MYKVWFLYCEGTMYKASFVPDANSGQRAEDRVLPDSHCSCLLCAGSSGGPNCLQGWWSLPSSHPLPCQSLHAGVGLVLGWASTPWSHIMGTCPLGPLWGYAEVCSGARQLDVSCMGSCCWPSLAPQSRCRLPSVKFQTLDLSLPCDTPEKSKELVWVRAWGPLRDCKGKRCLHVRA